MAMATKQFYALIMVFIAIVVGITLLIQSATIANDVTAPQTITNESITMPALNGTVSLTYDDLTVLTSIKNSSGSTLPTTNYTATLSTGKINYTDNSSGICPSGGTCLATYTFRSDNYVTDSTSRTLVNIIIILFAIGIIGVAAIAFIGFDELKEFMK